MAYGARFTPDEMVTLAAMGELRHLDLTHTSIDDPGVARLASSGSLVELRFVRLGDDPILTGSSVQALSEVETLQRLDLSPADITDADLEHVLSMTSLRWLWLPSGLSAQGLGRLAAHPALEELEVDGLEPGSLAALAPMAGLRVLRIRGGQLGPRDASALQAMESLEVLEMQDCAAPAGMIEVLSRLPHLTRLRVEGVRRTDVPLIAAMPALRELMIVGPQLTDSDLAPLAGLSALSELDLTDTRAGVGIQTTLESMTQLQQVILNERQVSESAAETMSEALGAVEVWPNLP